MEDIFPDLVCDIICYYDWLNKIQLINREYQQHQESPSSEHSWYYYGAQMQMPCGKYTGFNWRSLGYMNKISNGFSHSKTIPLPNNYWYSSGG